METNGMDMRQLKGQKIAETCRIVKTDKGWQVPSQSGHGTYLVYTESLLSKPKCTCPDHESRGVICKHIYAVEITLKKETDTHGNTTITAERVTYSQDWKAYDKAQCNEKDLFMKLLSDLCHNICVVIQETFELGINPQFNLPIQPQFRLKSPEDVKKVEPN